MKSGLPARFKILLVVPFIAAFLMVFACSNKQNSDNANLSSVNSTGNDSTDNSLLPPPPPPPPPIENANDNNLSATGDKVCEKADVMPQFVGGNEAMTNFLINNVKYPEKAKKAGKTGKVYVSFIVDVKGKVSNVKVVKSVDPELDAEAVRCVSLMPDWTPGKDKGKAVSVQLILPINFQLK